MKILFTLSIIVSMFLSSHSWAHGEDKLGPNKGYIRMPGAFHTEILAKGKRKLQVFLLDVNFKSPTVKNSAVKAVHQGEKTTEASCSPVRDSYFVCIFPKGVDLTGKGRLVLTSRRGDQKGIDVTYPLPLRLEKGQHDDHH